MKTGSYIKSRREIVRCSRCAKITFYKPVGDMLTGFFLRPYVPIAPAYFAPCKAARAARRELYNIPKMNILFLCNFFVDKLRSICYNKNDLWIAYEEGKVGHRLKMSNWIASNFQLPYLPSYTLSKWSNKSMQKILACMWPYNFLHFSQQYTVHIMARREKNRSGFSHVRVCGLDKTKFSPSNICLYI